VLDFYIFLGPGPEQVLQQYHAVIGLPAMVPHWSLGYHQCKWGYRTLGALQEVVEGYRQAGVPLEVIWSDIDYMDRYRCGEGLASRDDERRHQAEQCSLGACSSTAASLRSLRGNAHSSAGNHSLAEVSAGAGRAAECRNLLLPPP
jgi:hypothetical protein